MTFLADLLICLRFFSRLPMPETARERVLGAGGLAEAAALAPLAGLILSVVPVLVLALASGLGLSSFIAATLALASTVVLTGALHEDALADCADGFGGGRTRERKLAIMRDSAIGAYGAVAIVLSLVLRCAAISSAAAAHRGGTAIVVAAVLSRAACFVPLAVLPPAQRDGTGAATATGWRRMLVGCLGGAVVAMLFAAGNNVGVGRAAVAIVLAGLAVLAVSALAWRQIGGQTGDVAGAAQQAAEITVLLAFAAS